MNHGTALLSTLAIGALGATVAWWLVIPLIVGLLDRGR
jgi:hypothetical protein